MEKSLKSIDLRLLHTLAAQTNKLDWIALFVSIQVEI